MRYIRYKALGVLFFIIPVCICLLPACIKDQCAATVCRNGGVCVNGQCACPAGYEGVDCSSKWNEKFAGDWQASDNFLKDSLHRFYTIHISQDTARDSFYISGFADTLNGIQCVRNSLYKFAFRPDQKIDSVLTIKSGNGTMDADGRKVTGMYSFQRKDTIITSSFTWAR